MHKAWKINIHYAILNESLFLAEQKSKVNTNNKNKNPKNTYKKAK